MQTPRALRRAAIICEKAPLRFLFFFLFFHATLARPSSTYASVFTPSAPLSRLLFHFRSADDNVKTLPESPRCRGASFTRIPGADTERGDDVVDKAQAWKRWCVGARECRRNHGSPLRKITKEKNAVVSSRR